jgi:hypothetical protein
LSSGTHTITNNTIANNTQAGMYVDYGTVSLVNNIVAFAEKGVQIGSSATILAFSHNDVFGNTNADYVDYTPPSDMGNISLDPLFNDRANGNFHLLSGSPCIDAGDDSAVAGGSTDLDGRPRILGARVDIGAYEYTAASQPFQLADVTRCLSIACGVRACSPDDLSRLNVASRNAGLDILDAARLARKVAGLEANP